MVPTPPADGGALSPASPAVARIRRWLWDAALPFWGDRGVDRVHGGFVEMFDAEGRASAAYKRTRVLGRQIYVFSHAAVLGWPGALERAEHGYRFLVRHARTGPGRWARRMAVDGAVTDAAPDLYDIAFVLFALGWYARASGEAAPLALARETLDALEAMRRPEGGFAHELPMRGPRVQNPHMHLLEASLALMEAAPGEPRFRELADGLVRLSTRFIDGRGTLAEFYTDALEPAPGEAGRIVEPGHQFEWVWILREHGRLTGARHEDVCRRLYDWASTHGVDPAAQVTFNAVRDDGRPLDRGSRVWPNTERIKGAIAVAELGGPPATNAVENAVRVLFDRFLKPDGGWTDAVDAEGRPLAASTPASTLYHVFLAFAEALRASGAQAPPG